VVATSQGQLVALDQQGVRLWALSCTNGFLAGAPVVAGERVVFGTVAGGLMAVSAEAGQLLWQVQVPGSFRHGPMAVQTEAGWQVVWLAADDGALTSVDARDGRLRWRTPPTNRSDGAPGSDGQFLAFGNCDAAVHLFRAADGAPVARVPLGPESQMAGGVLVHHGRVYGGTRHGALVCVQAASSNLLWQVDISRDEAFVTPVAGHGLVFMGNAAGDVVACDEATGVVRWRVALSNEISALCVAEETLFAVAGGRLIGMRASDGRVESKQAIGDKVAGPVWHGQVVVVADDGGKVIAWRR
jgi:outer membrane protein assembly factor BamB